MMAGYTKLFASIIHSTVWQGPMPTKVVWVTLLALADRDGVIEASIPGLARAAGVSIAEAEAALAAFQQPDPYSRTPDNEGRRIEAVHGGWRLLNHAFYRTKFSSEHRADYQAEWKRKRKSGRQVSTGDDTKEDVGTKRNTRNQSRDKPAPSPTATPTTKLQKKIVTELASEPDGGLGEEKAAQDEKAAAEDCSAAPTRIEPVAHGAPRSQASAKAGNGREGNPGPGSCDTVAGAVSPGSSCHPAVALQVSSGTMPQPEGSNGGAAVASSNGPTTAAPVAGPNETPNEKGAEEGRDRTRPGSSKAPESSDEPARQPVVVLDLSEIPDREAALARAELEQRLKSGYGRIYQDGLEVSADWNRAKTVAIWIRAVTELGRPAVVEACVDDAGGYWRRTSGDPVGSLAFFNGKLERMLQTKLRHEAAGGT